MADITYEVVMHIGVLSQSNTGWTKEVNLVSWNDRPPKYDIRDWSPDHSQLGRGVTLSREELLALRDLLNQWDL
ncbi:MAG: YdbC family protein [Bacteroidota bacterium]